MFGLMLERQTLVSIITLESSPFLHLMHVAWVENASIHKYDIENCNKTVSAILDIEAYPLIEI